MKIAYLWIEEFRGLKQQGLNFDSQFKFIYNPKKHQLSVEENDNFIKDFYGESIVGITAIVGENGTGKTSILDFIKDRLGHERPFKNKLIIVYSKADSHIYNVIINTSEDKFHVETKLPENRFYSNIISLKSIVSRYKYMGESDEGVNPPISYIPQVKRATLKPLRGFRTKRPSLLELFPDFRESIIIFYSNIFDYRLEYSSYFVYNLSTNFLEASEGSKTRVSEIKSQVDFTAKSGFITQELGISLPDNIIVKFRSRNSTPSYSRSTLIDYSVETGMHYYVDYLMLHLENSIARGKSQNVRALIICLSLVSNFCYEICGNQKIKSIKEFLISYADLFDHLPATNVTVLKHLVDEVKRIVNKEIGGGDGDINKTNNLLASNIKKVFDFIIDFKLAPSKGSNFSVVLPVKGVEAVETKSFIEAYIGSFVQRGMIDIDWQDMSSGEKARLAFLSRLNSLKSDALFKKYGKNKDVVLLIDEGEQYFHPQWQKEYIKFLVNYVPKLFHNVKVQIILTSHSPFVLSDLFRENIIYLERDSIGKRINVIDSSKKERTLAANIHNLFTDAYFMKGGLIGSHAQDKMQEILAPLVKNEMTQEEKEIALKFINGIGEPLLRNRLISMYEAAIEN